MQIIPVIDLKNGSVVHAIRGERAHYAPIRSVLVSSPDAQDVAAGFANLGFEHVYVADLNAIAGQPQNVASFQAIHGTGMRTWTDVGVRSAGSPLPDDDIVIGLETLESLSALDRLIELHGSERFVLSLDHRDGSPLVIASEWRGASLLEIACDAVDRGITRLIDLDLSRVGTRQGPRGRGVAEVLRGSHPHIFLASGGGVRNAKDLQALAQDGYAAALVATALHDGSITADEAQRFL